MAADLLSSISIVLATVSIIIGIPALIGTSPFWLKLLLPYIYKPDFSFYLRTMDKDHATYSEGDTIPYEEIGNLGMQIRYNNSRWIMFDVVIHLWHPVEIDTESTPVSDDSVTMDVPQSTVARPNDTSHIITIQSGPIGDGSERMINLHQVNFPIERRQYLSISPSKRTFQAAVVPEVSLTEFGFPNFFGNAKLKPIVQRYEMENEDHIDNQPHY